MSRHLAWLFCFFAMLPTACAQQASAPARRHVQVASIPADPRDVSTIDGIVKAYYEVICGPPGKPRQWARDRTLYIPGIRFVIIDDDPKRGTTAHLLTHQEFVDASDADAVGKGFYERQVHRVMHRFGNVAHVFSTSEMRRTPDGPVLSRSLDSLEMYWDGKRWWIVCANIWPRERPDNPLPAEFRP